MVIPDGTAWQCSVQLPSGHTLVRKQFFDDLTATNLKFICCNQFMRSICCRRAFSISTKCFKASTVPCCVYL